MRNENTSLFLLLIAFLCGARFLLELDSLDALLVLAVVPVGVWVGGWISLAVLTSVATLLGIMRRRE